MSVEGLISTLQTVQQRGDSFPFSIDSLTEALRKLEGLIEIDYVKKLIVMELRKIIFKILEGKITLQPQMFHTLICGPSGCGKTTLAHILAEIWASLGILQSQKRSIITIDKEKFLRMVESFRKLSHTRNTHSYSQDQEWKKLGEELESILPIHETTEEGMVKVASRSSFVGEYAGKTEPKTISFLESHRGKCIIFDEAYSLCLSPEDAYGKEALAILIQWMEREANSNIFVFVGYRELMERLYEVQPGLERRLYWIFDIKGYTPQGLAKIFIQQCKLLDLSVEINVIPFFEERYEHFPHFGGDTAHLARNCETIHFSRAFDSMVEGEVDEKHVLTREELTTAFEVYLQTKMPP